MVTELEIENARTPAGGFTRATLESWGVPWPPPRGWKETLLKGSVQTKPPANTDRAIKSAIRQLTGFLGAQGCKTGDMSSAQIVRESMSAFGIEHEHDPVRVAEIVKIMGLPDRNKTVAEYLAKDQATPSVRWPARAKARFYFAASAAPYRRRV